MGNFVVLLFFEFFALILVAEIMTRRIPASVAQASDENRHRMDGTRSRRRSKAERYSHQKLRRDIWATLLGIAMTGNGLLAAMHYFVIPIPIAIHAMTSFSLDEETWKDNLREANIDSQFKDWQDSSPTHRQTDTWAAQQLLWKAWPVILLVVIVWFGLSLKFVAWAYMRSLREFAEGVSRRQQRYLNLDIGRLQELERDDSSGPESADAQRDACQQS